MQIPCPLAAIVATMAMLLWFMVRRTPCSGSKRRRLHSTSHPRNTNLLVTGFRSIHNVTLVKDFAKPADAEHFMRKLVESGTAMRSVCVWDTDKEHWKVLGGLYLVLTLDPDSTEKFAFYMHEGAPLIVHEDEEWSHAPLTRTLVHPSAGLRLSSDPSARVDSFPNMNQAEEWIHRSMKPAFVAVAPNQSTYVIRGVEAESFVPELANFAIYEYTNNKQHSQAADV